jgi:mannose-6-phosphate isomerase-like protein (cupin superfamily)
MADPFTTTTLADADPERFHRLRKPLGVETFGINQLLLEPGQRMRIHRHERQEEVFLVLAGRLTIAFEDGERDFEQGRLVRIAPEVRRQMINRGPERLSLLCLGGSGEHHEPRDAQAYGTWDDEPREVRDVPNPEDLPASELRSA